jgi:hypothetical protein
MQTSMFAFFYITSGIRAAPACKNGAIKYIEKMKSGLCCATVSENIFPIPYCSITLNYRHIASEMAE